MPTPSRRAAAERDAHRITRLLERAGAGDEVAERELYEEVHTDLRGEASRLMRRQAPGHLLQTTALLNEAYLRMVDRRDTPWTSRDHFLGFAVKTMRSVLVDQARRARAKKRGEGARGVPLDVARPEAGGEVSNLVALNEALERLEEEDPPLGLVVELHVFGGLALEETARALGVSLSTVVRRWRAARARLKVELGDGG